MLPSMPERPPVYALASQRPSLPLHHHGRQVRTHTNFPELVEGEGWLQHASCSRGSAIGCWAISQASPLGLPTCAYSGRLPTPALRRQGGCGGARAHLCGQ